MTDAVLRVSPQVHKEAKIGAAVLDMTLKEFTEQAIRYALKTNRLIDTRSEYTTKGEDNA